LHGFANLDALAARELRWFFPIKESFDLLNRKLERRRLSRRAITSPVPRPLPEEIMDTFSAPNKYRPRVKYRGIPAPTMAQ
jgi:hypothetical protein